jgi:hypothetical protein
MPAPTGGLYRLGCDRKGNRARTKRGDRHTNGASVS